MSAGTTIFVTLQQVTCIKCGLLFGLTASHQEALRGSHAEFFCPAGHPLHFPSKSDAEKLREQLIATERQRDQARESRDAAWKAKDAADRSAIATRGHLTRVKKRVHAGVCLHCNRSFENVARHMATKHARAVES